MEVTKILFIIPLLYNAQGLSAAQSDTNLANLARNVSVEFPSGSYTANRIQPTYTTKHTSSTLKYWTTQPTNPTHFTQSPTKYIPPCWTHHTEPTTARPIHTTPRYTPPTTRTPTTLPITKYIPPCWTHNTEPTTARPTYTTPRYTPPTTKLTTRAPTTLPITKYIPPCWTHITEPTTARPTYTTPRYTPPTTVSATKYMPPCWSQTTLQPGKVSTVAPLTITTPHSRTTVFPGLENYVCEKKNCFYSVPNECDTFIECKDNVARKHFCPEGLVYKPSTIWPAYPCVLSSEYQCLNGSITQPARPSAQCPHQDGFYPVPESDCSQYIVCEHGIATLMDCPTGLVFNEEKSICDWPVAVPSCHPNALKDFTCPSVDDTEADNIIYKYRYYNSCKNYVACQKGFPRLLSCPAGLHFDQDKRTCVDESYIANCEG